MTSSPIKARVPFPTFFDAADALLDTYYAQILANNALHLADGMGKVRVNWSPPSVATGVRLVALTTESPLPAVDTFFPIVTFGPFPSTQDVNGVYSMRVRIAGNLSTAGTGELRAVWSAQGRATSELALNGDNVLSMTLASATSAWKAGAAQVLTMTTSQVAAAQGILSTPVELNGDPSAVAAVMTTITVYGSSDTVTKIPTLTALYCAELAP